MPARIAATYELLSCALRCTGGRGTATSCAGAGAAVGGLAVAGAAARARLVVSGTVLSLAVCTRIVSCDPDDWGVEAVETGGAPLPTDSPQAVATNSTGARARAIAKGYERNMSDEIYASTESETRTKRAWGTGDPKANRAPVVASGDDWRTSVTSLLVRDPS